MTTRSWTRPHMQRAAVLAVACLWLAACSSLPTSGAVAARSITAASGSVYVIRRGWHVDVGVAVGDLRPPLSDVAGQLPGARFVLFGFGDRRYLLHGRNLLAALWPGAGIILATGVRDDLPETFGQENVVSAALDAEEMSALQAFVLATLNTTGGPLIALAPGPYPGSAYFESVQRYSGVHTCNTWAAQALRSAGLPVRVSGVAFAWQLWHQLMPLARNKGALAAAPPARPAR
jgi:hypothetical protein